MKDAVIDIEGEQVSFTECVWHMVRSDNGLYRNILL